MRNQAQLGVALMLVFPIKAALSVLLKVEPTPMLVAFNAAFFAMGLFIYLRAKDDTTD
jgi:lipopolysaccharide export LptBFGC system permease protein LptF